MNPCSVVPGLPKMYVTPSAISCSSRARLPVNRGTSVSVSTSAATTGVAHMVRTLLPQEVTPNVVAACRSVASSMGWRLHAERGRQFDSPVAGHRHHRGDLQPDRQSRQDDLEVRPTSPASRKSQSAELL